MRIEVSGQDLSGLHNEIGCHSVQRVAGRQSRVQTSLVTVAVLEGMGGGKSPPEPAWRGDEFQVEWYNGTVKAGGQHHQKNATCCRITHLPTGLRRTAQTRSRQSSLAAAMEAIGKDLAASREAGLLRAANDRRVAQAGSGGRGEKRRTYRFQEGIVLDHRTGRQARLRDVLGRGGFRALWS